VSAVLKPVDRTQSVDSLVVDWIDAKRDEDAANKRRVAIESLIIEVLGEPDEGSATHELADGSKLVVTAKITRSIDEAVWRSIMSKVPVALRPITFVETPKLDLKGLRWLQEHQPEIYAYCAQALTAKKAKSSISVKV